MKSVIIEEAELLCHAGDTPAAVLEALQSGTRPAMQTATVGGTPVPVAAVCTPLQLPPEPGYATRTNALLLHCLGKKSIGIQMVKSKPAATRRLRQAGKPFVYRRSSAKNR
ncbi:MAG: hypothetical protein E7033_05480 [Akkermansiaceae bacterium]|nr:hypothetical protein [Akkermansiaceae bacterium]